MRIYSYNEWRTYGVIVDWRLREYDRSIAVLQVVVALPIPSNITKYIYIHMWVKILDGTKHRAAAAPSLSASPSLTAVRQTARVPSTNKFADVCHGKD